MNTVAFFSERETVMTLVQERTVPSEIDVLGIELPKERHRRRRTEALIVFGLSFAAYFAVAMLLDFKYHSFQGDSIARMANGFYILHSRDPHLAAVGFVWNPLSSIVDVPLLLFNSWLPFMASHNVAGTTMSAIAMAAAAYQLHALLREWGVRFAPRILLTAVFVLNPMVLYFGGNGMSEALYLFCMLAASRYLSRWLWRTDLPSLVYSAIALGFGYLERTEPIAGAALATPLVLLVAYSRSDGDRRHRIWMALTDAIIFVIPITTALIAWAAVSYVITGQPFQQITSKYGNATLLANSHQVTRTVHDRLIHEVQAVTSMAPLLILIAITALVVAIIRRNIGAAGFVLILGGGLGFTLASFLANAIFPWYRYYILLVPIEVLLVGSMFAIPTRIDGSRAASRTTSLQGLGAFLLAVALLGPSLFTTGKAMTNVSLAPDVIQAAGYFYFPDHPLDPSAYAAKYSYAQIETVARYFDSLHLPNGDVVADNANGCTPNVYTNVTNPRIFVIHNDRDFQRTLDDPLTFHAHYLFVGLASDSDAVLGQYPNIATESWTKLVHTFRFNPGNYCNGFRLFRVLAHPNGNY